MPITLPIPVNYCRFCGEYSHKDEDGFFSIDIDQWFCNITCYYQARLSMGDLGIKNNALSQELLRLRETVYQPDVIKRRKDRARQAVQMGRIKFIRKTHAREDVVQDQDK